MAGKEVTRMRVRCEILIAVAQIRDKYGYWEDLGEDLLL